MIRCLLILGLWSAPPPATDAAETLPSLELLEFLGQFETVDGEWLDPFGLDAGGTGDDDDEDDEDDHAETDDAGTGRADRQRPGDGH